MWLPNSCATTTEPDDTTTVWTVHLIRGHAFVEIAPGYLLWIAPEADGRRELADTGRLALVTDAARHMMRGLVIRASELVTPPGDTVH